MSGLLFTVQKALPLMPEGATIIILNASASIVGTPAFSVYGATKAAVRSFARYWTLDLKERKIRVNAMVLAWFRLLVTINLDSVKSRRKNLWRANKNIPLGRVGTPDEIAKAVVFLASDDSSFVNNDELFVDGGMAQI